MPMSNEFRTRLSRVIHRAADHFGTPFHIYDETGIRQTGDRLKKAFAAFDGFREYFAVKALPNPSIMAIMKEMGFGFDCSSSPELILARQVGALGEQIMFTSNNTSQTQFAVAARDGGCILNLDDVSLVPKVPDMPELICFRYNPGDRRQGNVIIGKPAEAKYGVTHEQVELAYRSAMERGAKRFGIHTMLASNERDYTYMVETAHMMLDIIGALSEKLGIRFEFINIGGGLGIPYTLTDAPIDIESMGKEIRALFTAFQARYGWLPRLSMESGRYMTGPHGALVTTVINHKAIYRNYIGVDASMSALMRPGMYGAYHHIHVIGKEESTDLETVDVVGSLCENNDKFAIQRKLPKTVEGDLLVIHDTGAHGHAMGFNYNGNLRPKELLLKQDGSIELIRREETVEDYFKTLTFEKNVLPAGGN